MKIVTIGVVVTELNYLPKIKQLTSARAKV